MLSAFLLALRQLGDRQVLGILGRCIAITLALFIVLGVACWRALDALLALVPIPEAYAATAEGLRGIVALVAILVGGWLLWRVLALAVLQFHADEVVEAVEARHYPAALAQARKLGWREELAVGARGVLRALGYNLLALPLALILLATGIGAALVFLAVNAVLLGRELTEMVWLRHRHAPTAPLPLGRWERLLLGAVVALLFTLPVANFLAPFVGAAMATHLVHRKGAISHAP